MEQVKPMETALSEEYVIETRSLTKRFPTKVAVDHINMHVKKGDIYGLIGKNGAGKTTAMKLILGIMRPSAGQIKLFGSTRLFKMRSRIGSLIETPGFYKGCTAFENMKRFAIVSGGTDQEINELLDFVGLGDVGKKKAGHFSLGMKQRLGIAIALLGNPDLLILDEPINGLDPTGMKEIRDLILKLNREKGVTFMISSHLLDELGKIATTYGIINNGELVEEITAEELEDRCRQGLKIAADDINQAEAILKESGFTDISHRGESLLVHTDLTRSAEINTLLVKKGIAVSELTVLNYGFEDYFIERLGK